MRKTLAALAILGAAIFSSMNSVADTIELENPKKSTFEEIYKDLPKPHLNQYMNKTVPPPLKRKEDLENQPSIDISLRGYSVNDSKMFSGQRVPYNGVNFDSRSDPDWLLRNLIVSSKSSDRMVIYREVGKTMPFDSQIQFISKLGLDMVYHYDYRRFNAGIGASESIECDDILNNLRTSNKLGVCRDIVMSQAQILERMGNRGYVYGLSFATPGNMHLSLLATDPNNPNRIHKIAYNRDSIEEEQVGIAALSQDEYPDVGFLYRVWRPNGEMVSSLPSQMGLVLNETTGGINNQDYDPFIRQDYDLAQIRAKQGSLHAQIFMANLSNGDPIWGVATHIPWKQDLEEVDVTPLFQNIEHSGHIGFAYAHRNTSAINGITGITTEEYDLNQAYLNFQERVDLFSKPQNFTFNPYIDFRLQAAVIEGGRKKQRGLTGDGDITLDTGVRVSLQSEDAKTNGMVSMYLQTTLGLDDVRALFGANVIPVMNHFVISGDIEHAVSPLVKLNAGLLYASRAYGDSLLISAGAASDTTRFSVGLYTPLTEQQQGWMPGGARTNITTSIQQKLGKFIDLGMDYTQSLKDDNFNLKLGLELHLSSK